MGSHFLLQGLFLTQAWNSGLPHLLHWQAGSLPPAPPGNPLCILWVLTNAHYRVPTVPAPHRTAAAPQELSVVRTVTPLSPNSWSSDCLQSFAFSRMS